MDVYIDPTTWGLMAPPSASFHSAQKGLERMKDESWLNTSPGNGAGLRSAEGRSLFQPVDQRSGEGLERPRRAGMEREKKESVGYSEECDKK